MKKYILVALFSLYIIPSAKAQEERDFERRGPPPNFEEIKAKIEAGCAEDLENFCADAEGREVMKCLHKNRTSLSESCREALPPRPLHHRKHASEDEAASNK